MSLQTFVTTWNNQQPIKNTYISIFWCAQHIKHIIPNIIFYWGLFLDVFFNVNQCTAVKETFSKELLPREIVARVIWNRGKTERSQTMLSKTLTISFPQPSKEGCFQSYGLKDKSYCANFWRQERVYRDHTHKVIVICSSWACPRLHAIWFHLLSK